MNEDQIRERVKAAVASVCGVSAANIGDNAHFVNDLGLDSLSVIEAAVELDREFRMNGSLSDTEKLFESVDDAVLYIYNRTRLQIA